jgi:hypothetical protein
MSDSNKPTDAQSAPTPSEPTQQPVATNDSAAATVQKVKKPRSKWLMPAALVSALVLGGGAAAYVGVIQQSPENIWKKSMSATSKGIEELLNKSITDNKKGMVFDGDFKVTNPAVVEASLEGKLYENNATMTMSVAASGIRLNGEIRTKAAENSENPDLYMKVTGLENLDSLAAGLGVDQSVTSLLAEVNDQWYMIDHTLLDQATASAGDSSTLSPEDAKLITEKVTTVMRERLFTDDASKAVITVTENVGKEDFEGASTYHYKIKMNKETTKDFVTALKDALKETKLKDLVLMGDTSKNFEEVIGFDGMIESIESTNFDNAKADVWVDMKTKFVRNVRIGVDENAFLDIGLPYDGGSSIPFVIKITGEDDEAKGSVTLKMTINKDSLDTELNIDVDIDYKDDMSDDLKMGGKMTFKPTDEKVNVDAPDGAKNILEFVGGLMGAANQELSLPYGDDSLYPEGFDSSLYDLESL